METRNKRWSDDEFLEKRKEVLAQWKTGAEVDLEEAIAYHKRLPPEKVHSKVYDMAEQEEKPILSIQLGHATVEETAEHLRFVAAAGARVPHINSDSYTRKCRFDLAERGLEESVKAGRSLLNGYPIVNHGVMKSRKLVESIPVPVSLSTNADEDNRLQAEITYACGMTGGLFDSIRELVMHCKDYPLDKRIQNDQYQCRLAAYYTERGAPINLATQGSVLGLCPPGLGGALEVFEILIAAEQGVKYVDFFYDCRGGLVQDVAAIRATKDIIAEYLHRFGYHDVKVHPLACPWFGEWPADQYQAASLLAWFTAVSALGDVRVIRLRSILEAIGIPDKEANVSTIKIARQMLENNFLENQRLPESPELMEEEEMFKMEVRALVDSVIDVGDGDLAVGMVKAVQLGMLDFPFSCWINFKGKVLAARDRTGAMRYLETGNLPLPKAVVDYHRRKIADREKLEGRVADIETVIRDLRHFARPLA